LTVGFPGVGDLKNGKLHSTWRKALGDGVKNLQWEKVRDHGAFDPHPSAGTFAE